MLGIKWILPGAVRATLMVVVRQMILVGARPRGRAALAGVAAGGMLLLSACGVGRSHSAPPTTTPTTTATSVARASTTPATTAATTTTIALTATIPSSVPLASRVIAAPDGYSLSTSSDATNGAISAADFDHKVGHAGMAAALGFASGYDVTYDNDDTSESIEVFIGQFSTSGNATRFRAFATQTITDEAPSTKTISAIPGAIALDATKPANGFYDHEVVATKASTVMLVDYSTDGAGQAPSDLINWAQQQYSRL